MRPRRLIALVLFAAATALAQTPAVRQAPVVVRGQTLFRVPAQEVTISPEQRANAIAAQVEWLTKDPLRIHDLRLEETGGTTVIISHGVVIARVTDSDARSAGKPRSALAREYLQAIQSSSAIRSRRRSLRLGLLFLAIATVLLVVAIYLIRVGIRLLHRRVDAWQGSIRLQGVELMSAERLRHILHGSTGLIRFAATLALLYAYLAIIASLFPRTRPFSHRLLGYVLNPVRVAWHGAADYLPNLVFLVVIAVIAYYLIRIARALFDELGKGTLTLRGFYPEWALPTYNIVRVLIAAFAVVVAFPYLPGAKSPAFQGVSIFFGLLLSLGSTAAISNIVAGTALTYTRAFSVGDRVQIGDTVGDVIEKTLLVTRVRTVHNEDVSVPNANVLSSSVVNFSSMARTRGLILHTGVTIGYSTPWRQVHSLLIGAAEATPHLMPLPPPYVRQLALNDFFVTYEVHAHTDQASRMTATLSELRQNIQDKFFEAGVEIMSPHVYGVRDQNAAAIPDRYLPANYAAPAFRVAPAQPPAPPAKSGPAASDDVAA